MNYRQPILIFGIAIPLLIMAAIGGAIFYAYKSINDKATVKEKGHAELKLATQRRNMLLDEFNATREVVEVWNDLLVENIDQTLITRIPHLRNQFPEDELTGDFPRPTTSAGGLGTTTRQPFSRSTINFRGAWHPMQQFLIELETSLPQLQLESLTITPDRNPEFLNYSLQYTAWNKTVE